jgi:hypothetical protein
MNTNGSTHGTMDEFGNIYCYDDDEDVFRESVNHEHHSSSSSKIGRTQQNPNIRHSNQIGDMLSRDKLFIYKDGHYIFFIPSMYWTFF